jgi:hypothetical protein
VLFLGDNWTTTGTASSSYGFVRNEGFVFASN